MLWSTVSNAADRSNKESRTTFLLSRFNSRSSKNFYQCSLCAMIGTVGRLERLLEFIGVHMMFDLIIDCPLCELRQKAKIRDRPIVFVSQF